MKRITVLILLLSLVIASLVSCNEIETESSVDVPNESVSVTESSLTDEESDTESTGENSEQSEEESIETPEMIRDVTVSETGYTDDSRIYEKAISDENKRPVIYAFDTKEEIDSFKSEYGDLFQIEGNYEYSFNEATAKYDEAFFENNTLIVLYLRSDSCGDKFEVGEIYNDLSTLRITVLQTKKGFDTGLAGWFITVAMPDATMKNLTTYIAEVEDAT